MNSNREEIVIDTVKSYQPSITLSDLYNAVCTKGITSKQTLKEILWKLVEENKLSFTDDWTIKIKLENYEE